MKSASRAAAIFQNGLDLLYPCHCVECGNPTQHSPFRYLCGDCTIDLYEVSPPCCTTCGFPYFGAMGGPRTGPHCLDLDPDFDQGRTLLLYRSVGRRLIQEFKFRQATYLSGDIVRLIERRTDVRDLAQGADIVPVPLHPRRLRERGFNQSLVLARCIAQAVPECSVADVLLRTRDTPSQTTLNRSEREKNVKGAFTLGPQADAELGERVVLVDDVFTTGHTLNACSRVLRAAGANIINVLTLGHG